LLALHRTGYRPITLAVVPVWLLLAVVSLAGFTTGPAGALGFAAISAVIATIPVIGHARYSRCPGGIAAVSLIVPSSSSSSSS
jgi:hypothetical protein